MRAKGFVLHLARATKRYENALALTSSCGLDCEIWPAIDGAAMPPSELAQHANSDLFEPFYPFPLKPAEIACFLGHRQIWAEIVRCDLDFGLVLEDDVSLDTSVFPYARELAERHIERLGYIQLQDRPPRTKSAKIDSVGSSVLRMPLVTPVRASAQLISASAARHLLDMSQRFDRPVDTFVQSHWLTKLRPGVIYPSGVSTISDKLDGSTIQGGRKTLSERIVREIRRFRYRRALVSFSRRSTAPT